MFNLLLVEAAIASFNSIKSFREMERIVSFESVDYILMWFFFNITFPSYRSGCCSHRHLLLYCVSYTFVVFRQEAKNAFTFIHFHWLFNCAWEEVPLWNICFHDTANVSTVYIISAISHTSDGHLVLPCLKISVIRIITRGGTVV